MMQLLETINSAFFGLSTQVTTLGDAIERIGVRAATAISIAITLAEPTRSQETSVFNRKNYWRRAIYSAAAARAIAARVLPEFEFHCFAAALMTDLGTLALDDALSRVESAGRNLASQLNGQQSARAQSIVEGNSRIPQEVRTIARMPASEAVGDDETLARERPLPPESAAILELASRCVHIFVGDHPAESIANVRATAHERFGLSDTITDDLLRRTGEDADRLALALGIRFQAGDYDALMESCSHRLLELSLSRRFTPPPNKRLIARLRRDGRVSILPCSDGPHANPIEARIRDISARGLGLLAAGRLMPGEQFVLDLPQPDGFHAPLLYTVTRCTGCEGQWSLGAELMDVLPVQRPGEREAIPSRK